jgi:hypothetical protein
MQRRTNSNAFGETHPVPLKQALTLLGLIALGSLAADRLSKPQKIFGPSGHDPPRKTGRSAEDD